MGDMPMLGWVGFGGGYKPAIAFARRPRREEEEEEEEESESDPCAFGTALDLVISGLVPCLCLDLGGGSSLRFSNFNGINTAHTITGVSATYPWTLMAGTADWELFFDPFGGGDCTGAPTLTGTVNLVIILTQCATGTLEWRIVTEDGAIPTTSGGYTLFGGQGVLDAAVANGFTCAGGAISETGTLTASLP